MGLYLFSGIFRGKLHWTEVDSKVDKFVASKVELEVNKCIEGIQISLSSTNEKIEIVQNQATRAKEISVSRNFNIIQRY